jgi:hypothetical protein
MKRTALARHTPLEQKTPLRRTTALDSSPLSRSALHAREPRHSKRRTAQPVPTRLRIALALRSEGKCEIGGPGCTVVATDLAHRKKVGVGGRKGAAARSHHVLSNALHACRPCHALGHAEPAAAYAAGWMLREHQDPNSAPVFRRGQWCLLGDDGSVVPLDGAEAA